MSIDDICYVGNGKTPIITTAVHAGHDLSEYLNSNSKLTEFQRFREEDPFTDIFAKASQSYIIVKKSRFEVDLNRTREKAVYLHPKDAWGLDMWRERLSEKIIKQSLKEYDLFYERLKALLDSYIKIHGKLIVLDLHSYNHRRGGSKAPFENSLENPEINLGTGTMQNRDRWSHLIEICQESLSSYNVMGRFLDVRENIKFKGGHLAKWIHKNYPDSICCISIEFKKIFMNEWSGQPDKNCIYEIQNMLKETIRKLQI